MFQSSLVYTSLFKLKLPLSYLPRPPPSSRICLFSFSISSTSSTQCPQVFSYILEQASIYIPIDISYYYLLLILYLSILSEIPYFPSSFSLPSTFVSLFYLSIFPLFIFFSLLHHLKTILKFFSFFSFFFFNQPIQSLINFIFFDKIFPQNNCLC